MSTDALPLPDLDSLPDDLLLLKQLVRQLLEALQTQHAQTDKLQRHLDLLIRKMYGRSSEKIDPRQLALFDVMAPEEQAALPADAANVASEQLVPRRKKKGHGRRPKPDTQEVVHIVHDLTDAEKQALGAGGVLVPLASEFTEPRALFCSRNFGASVARRFFPFSVKLSRSADWRRRWKPMENRPTVPWSTITWLVKVARVCKWRSGPSIWRSAVSA